MKQKPCIFLLDTAAASLPTSFSATDQLPLLSGMDTPVKSSENEQQMDGSPACECMKGMSACLIHPSTPDKWIASMRDSLAKTLALLESKQAYLREPDQVFTAKSCALLAWFDQNSCSWRTYQQSFLTDSEPYSETWPRWGMTQGGSAYAHPMSERRITETDGSYSPAIPTPCAGDWRGAAKLETLNRKLDQGLRGHMGQLPNWTRMFPTPNASDSRDRGNMSQPSIQRRAAIGKQLNLSMVVHPTSGQLNPSWVEWLMGFPIGFTVSKGWATPKSRSKPQPHGES
jgi:hypothetical protein